MYGKIIRSLAGFYDVYAGGALYRCRARGVFRALGVKPLVGDDVEITVTDTVSDPMEGSVDKVLPRKNPPTPNRMAAAARAAMISGVRRFFAGAAGFLIP